jgi:hypothetical protein
MNTISLESSCFPSNTNNNTVSSNTCIGGTCNPTTLMCECFPGRSHDLTLIRVANCANIDSSDKIALGLSVSFGLCTFLLNIYYLRKVWIGSSRKTNSGVFHVIVLNMCVSISLMIGSAVHLGEGYASPAFWFFYMIGGLFIGATLAGIFDTFLRVSFNSAMQPYPQRFVWVSLACMVISLIMPFLICFIAAILYEKDAVAYNNMLVIGLGLLPSHLIVSAPMFFSTVDQLILRTDEALGKSLGSHKPRQPSVFLGAVSGGSSRRLLLSQEELQQMTNNNSSSNNSPLTATGMNSNYNNSNSIVVGSSSLPRKTISQDGLSNSLPGNSITSSTFSTPMSTPLSTETKHVVMTPEEKKANRQSLRELPVVGETNSEHYDRSSVGSGGGGSVVGNGGGSMSPLTIDTSTANNNESAAGTVQSPPSRISYHAPKLALIRGGSRSLKEPSDDNNKTPPGDSNTTVDQQQQRPVIRLEKSVSSNNNNNNNKDKRASLSNNNPENPRNVNRTFQSLSKRLRTFKWVMLFIWAPLEIGGAIALAMLALFRSPYTFVAFEILVVAAPLVAVNFLAVVVRVKPRLPSRSTSQRFALNTDLSANSYGPNNNNNNNNNAAGVVAVVSGKGGGGGVRDHSSDNESGSKHLSKKRSKETQLATLINDVAIDGVVTSGKSEVFKNELLSVVSGTVTTTNNNNKQ